MNKKYFLGWADANNMENGVREKIVDIFAKREYQLLRNLYIRYTLCSS